MFKQLRNKFLILNIMIITILQVAAFSGIYMFTSNRMKHSLDNRLSHELYDFVRSNLDDDFKSPPAVPESDFIPEPLKQMWIVSFKTDSNGDVIKKKSAFDVENGVFERITLAAERSDTDSGVVKADNGIWAYKFETVSGGGLAVCAAEISREKGMLNNLIVTFIYIGAIALLIIFFISLYFANRAIKPISEAWEKQNRFIADASHELKTPLTVINTNADVLLSHSDSTIGEEKKWIYYIKDETQRMTRLTNDLLLLARLDNDKTDMQNVEFSLSETVETVLLTMEAVLYENNLKFTCDIADGIKIYGNPDSIKQLVMILMDNAVKYTPDGGSIEVCLKKQDEKAVLSVSNTGEPLPQEERKRIFDRFYRADKSRTRSSGGYGLGLAIAYSICRSHGGSISVKSSDGKNTFTVIL